MDYIERYGSLGLEASKWIMGEARKCRRPIFEFGTFEGQTTRLLAKASQVLVYTLDLDDGEGRYGEYNSGWMVEHNPRVIRLRGDSKKLKFDYLHGKCDLILIDGGHDYETVRSDSFNAFRMVAPGGKIVWDDPGWDGVKQCLDELKQKHKIEHIAPQFLEVFHNV